MKIIQVCLAIALSTMFSNSALAEWTDLYGFVKGFAAPDTEYMASKGYDEEAFVRMKVLSGSEAGIGNCTVVGDEIVLKIRSTEISDSLYATAMHAYSNNSLVQATIDETDPLGKSGSSNSCYLLRLWVADWEAQL